jgi:hypothetical protein
VQPIEGGCMPMAIDVSRGLRKCCLPSIELAKDTQGQSTAHTVPAACCRALCSSSSRVTHQSTRAADAPTQVAMPSAPHLTLARRLDWAHHQQQVRVIRVGDCGVELQ